MKNSLDVTGTPIADTYLFRSQSMSAPFVPIEEDMAQLNDFSVAFLESTQARVQGLELESKHGVGGNFKDVDGEDISILDEDVRFGAEAQLDVWRDTSDFLARANCLLLVAVFTEKSLIGLCRSIGNSAPRARGGQSKVAACIEFLKTTCSLSFEEPAESVSIRERCRDIRNAFAHGDWEDCRELVGAIELPDAFRAVTGLLNSIETAYMNSGSKIA